MSDIPSHHGFHATYEAALEGAHILSAFEGACEHDASVAAEILTAYATGHLSPMETLKELYAIAGIHFVAQEPRP